MCEGPGKVCIFPGEAMAPPVLAKVYRKWGFGGIGFFLSSSFRIFGIFAVSGALQKGMVAHTLWLP